MKRNAALSIGRKITFLLFSATLCLMGTAVMAQNVTPQQMTVLQQQQQLMALQQLAAQQQAAQLYGQQTGGGFGAQQSPYGMAEGFNSQPQITGYDPVTGQPIYASPQPQQQVKINRVMAEDLDKEVLGTNNRPPALKDLQDLPKENIVLDKNTAMPIDIRRDALREAAVSFGARGGLAWRTFEIRKELEARSDYMEKVYDFRQLLIPAPSGLLIEPPVISESINAMLIEGDGQQAAVSDRIYNIVNNAKIVPTSRTWRNYLEREWGDIDPPPDILRPENDEERKIWVDLVRKGWEEGMTQADEIFQDDLNTLQADFQGMIRYRILLAQGMVSPPYALQVDRGVTGDGDEMRVGDRAVQITGKPELITGSESWQPANR